MNNRIMRFQDYRFKTGENVTIRRGTKWDIGRTDGVLIGRETGEPTGAIDIVETMALRTIYGPGRPGFGQPLAPWGKRIVSSAACILEACVRYDEYSGRRQMQANSAVNKE